MTRVKIPCKVYSVIAQEKLNSEYKKQNKTNKQKKKKNDFFLTFLFLNENIYCGSSFESAHRGASYAYHNFCSRSDRRKMFILIPSYLELCNLCCFHYIVKEIRNIFYY